MTFQEWFKDPYAEMMAGLYEALKQAAKAGWDAGIIEGLRQAEINEAEQIEMDRTLRGIKLKDAK